MISVGQRNVPQETEPKFDMTVTKYDKLGRVIGQDPYRMFLFGSEQYFERPKFSGNLFYGDGSAAGRLSERTIESTDEKTKRPLKYIEQFCDLGAKHIEYVAPLTEDQKLAAEVAETRTANAALEAEIAALCEENERMAKERELEQAKAAGGLAGVVKKSEGKA